METSNLQRTLVLCSRGATRQQRIMIAELARLLPHSKKESKVDRKKHFSALNDLAEMHSCNNILYLEGRKKLSFLWIIHYPSGPSVKFAMQNLHSSEELRLTGNCLKASRPILSFDNSFKSTPTLQLVQQIFTQTFATPQGHPKSMPFIDHVFSFSHINNKIYFRNFEVTEKNKEISLTEIGPRFVLTLIKVLDGVTNGETLYKNGKFLTPTQENSAKMYEKRKEKDKMQKQAYINLQEPNINDVFGY